MLTLEQQEEFWSDLYRDRPIAIYNRAGKWHVYLDHVLQHNMVFATAEHAVRWLRGRVDNGCVSAPAAWETALAA
jgi:hypothetical protein